MHIELNEALIRYPKDVPESPEEIADALLELLDNEFDSASDEVTDTEKADIVDGIYYIQTCAENSHNSNYFRSLYNLLALVTQNYDSNLKRKLKTEVAI